jgi:hypothetical protein
MQIINHIKWFLHVLNNIGGTPLVLQCAIVGPNNTIQLENLFWHTCSRTISLLDVINTPPLQHYRLLSGVALHRLRRL